MNLSWFIAHRLRYKGRVVVTVVAVSFLVMIIAVAVAAGFRREIRNGISSMTGDIQLMTPDMNYLDEASPVSAEQSWLPAVSGLGGVESVVPVVYRAGIVRHDEDIYGVLVKGVPSDDTLSLSVSVPSSFAEKSGISPGDRLLTYFVGEKVKVRQFIVGDIYEPMIKTDDRFLIFADIDDMRRLNGWDETQASMFDVCLEDDYRDEELMARVSGIIGNIIHMSQDPDDEIMIASSVKDRYPQIFDWMDLIDFNVIFILILMIVVAGVNMISGLLIMLFENIPTIGLLKSIGMTDGAVARVFLTASATLVLKGMFIGNALAVAFCLIQDHTHVLKLDPDNYFVSFVPVNLDLGAVLTADAAAFAAIMLLLLIPSLFISKVDPAETVKMK